ncbi:MAG TPA: hypothetical protein VK281_12465 [Xanthobacteraceae bacterium]|nr:hypothetical protein [Xanthobacteraceae bacterium]
MMKTTVMVHGKPIDMPLVVMMVNGKRLVHCTRTEMLMAVEKLEHAVAKLRSEGLQAEADEVAEQATMLGLVAERRDRDESERRAAEAAEWRPGGDRIPHR